MVLEQEFVAEKSAGAILCRMFVVRGNTGMALWSKFLVRRPVGVSFVVPSSTEVARLYAVVLE